MERTIKFNSKNITFYLLGFFILGLGVNLMLRANLGAGPWDTVTANLKDFLTVKNISVTLGTVSFVIASIMMITVLLYTRKWVLIGMIFPMLIVAVFIDVWDIVLLGEWVPTDMSTRIFISLSGGVLIPLGLSLVIASHFPAFVFDELTLMMMNITGIKSITIIRAGIELLGVTLGIVFGLLAMYRLGDVGPLTIGAVGPASVIVVLMLPPLLEFFVKVFNNVTLEQFKRQARNMFFYILGMTTIAISVVMMLRSNIGNSSWDTLHFSLHSALPITIGNAMIGVAAFFTILVIIFNKNLTYLFMFVPIILVGYLVDFFDLIALVDFEPSTIPVRIVSYLIGLLGLPLGGSMLLVSTYPAGVFDEFMLTMMRMFKTNKMMLVRGIMEVTAVILAFIIGLQAGIGFGKIGIGTLIFSISVGAFVKMYLSIFERMNLYENKQTD